MKELNLSHNQIEAIDEQESIFKDMDNLIELVLSSNQLKAITYYNIFIYFLMNLLPEPF